MMGHLIGHFWYPWFRAKSENFRDDDQHDFVTKTSMKDVIFLKDRESQVSLLHLEYVVNSFLHYREHIRPGYCRSDIESMTQWFKVPAWKV